MCGAGGGVVGRRTGRVCGAALWVGGDPAAVGGVHPLVHCVAGGAGAAAAVGAEEGARRAQGAISTGRGGGVCQRALAAFWGGSRLTAQPS